ncbi:hypothetical protein AGMMS49960_14530 [Betaproteobacteria bacterium]|nr:hypothetical protein AGMMS49543_19440 [Betaproteobacteria bacterium]GHU02377.1 hypothetical protein AGMMS49960_14530 [Betaproteobacteria bacterium]GHU15197.1 hypothetical protein AGMMS50225_28310 [Betaproteobacteria bacterium]GHU19918.1 hypothetical protein AGMMS50243_13120 [Betaproteobacteria bacterium]
MAWIPDKGDVVRLTILEFWNGAISEGLYAWEIDDTVDAPSGPWDNPWETLLSSRIQENTMHWATKNIAEAYPGSLLVRICFVYGGDIAAVCGDLSVSKRSPK